jgi:mannitol-specific phosphotransferase system IIBC component
MSSNGLNVYKNMSVKKQWNLGTIALVAGFVLVVVIGILFLRFRNKKTSSDDSKSRSYIEVKTDDKKSGKCDAKGTVSKDVKSSDRCASACDADSTPCNGYDWDGKLCTLYADAPTKVSQSTTDKCFALKK